MSSPTGESSFAPMASFIGWMFLPNLVTGWVQSFLYRLFTRAGDPIPPTGSPRYMRDRKFVYCFVVAAYLMFTTYECWVGITSKPTFYQLLGVPVDADEKLIKKEFRRASIKYHPDKVGSGMEHVFMQYKVIYDVLSDPVKRFAYERLGPSMTTSDWILCKTQYDFILHAGRVKWPHYAGSLIVLVVLSAFGYLEFGKYWRFLSLSCMLVFDYASVTRPFFLSSTNVLQFITRRTLLPFEQVALAQQVLISTIIAISQLSPLFQQRRKKWSDKMYSEQLDRMVMLAVTMMNEAKASADMELAPFMKPDGSVDRDLKMRISNWLVERRIESEPQMRDAMGRIIEKRKREGGKPSSSSAR
ncbi:hypothetical protein DRE_07567 [Drechslerella stenobrocha 248]|uniref:J domain-containing protein n=1 Tax=Drechslerella stenobrocha 248 TaxID=1043628 RepID=W7HSP1_9PEZI|nr:hypothetical protein DRE_07567 [Drechslerella stenobrocha 248]